MRRVTSWRAWYTLFWLSSAAGLQIGLGDSLQRWLGF